MKIEPSNVRKIFEHESKWDDIKSVKDSDLVEAAGSICKHADKKDHKELAFAARIIAALGAREYGKTHAKELDALKDKVKKISHNLTLAGSHVLEAAPIEAKAISRHTHKETVHIYPSSKKTKKVIEKWQKSGTAKSLSDFIKKEATGHEKHDLKKNVVRYLSKEEQSKYEVSFSHGKIKIGGHTPKDKEYMFALNSEGTKLLAGEKKRGEFHHSSFFAGAPVQCAGLFKVKSGKIAEARLHSGHYKPTPADGEKLRAFLGSHKRLGSHAATLAIKAH